MHMMGIINQLRLNAMLGKKINTCIFILFMYIYKDIYIYLCIFSCICMHVYGYMYKNICMYMYIEGDIHMMGTIK
jgi:hypothetical protein